MIALPQPEPPLAGTRYGLRLWVPEDASALTAAWADPEVRRRMPVPTPADETVAAKWISGCASRRMAGLALDLAVVGLSEPDRAVVHGPFLQKTVVEGRLRRRETVFKRMVLNGDLLSGGVLLNPGPTFTSRVPGRRSVIGGPFSQCWHFAGLLRDVASLLTASFPSGARLGGGLAKIIDRSSHDACVEELRF